MAKPVCGAGIVKWFLRGSGFRRDLPLALTFRQGVGYFEGSRGKAQSLGWAQTKGAVSL